MKILIISATVGGGHQAAAKTLAKEFAHLGSEVKIVDGLDGQSSVVKKGYAGGYAFLTEKLPWVWKIKYLLADNPVFQRFFALSFFRLSYNFLEKQIQQYQPDKIVCTYFGWPVVVRSILKKHRLPGKLFTVVTDKFTLPRLWFLEKESEFLVFSEQAKKAAVENKISEEKIHLFEDIVDSKFSQRLTPEKIARFKQVHSFSPHKPLVLIVGGGESMPNGLAIVSEILKANISASLAIVCGRNEKLKTKLEKLSAKYSRQNVKIFGFVDFLYELMNAADIVISKAGPATVIEALLLGKPLILSHYIWKQELGNVRFVVENNLGYYEPDPRQLASRIEDLIKKPNKIQRLQENIQKANLKTNPEEVAKFITK